MVTDNQGTLRLVIEAPAELAGLVMPLSGQKIIIGHSETADLVLEDRFVSRRHALITVGPSGQATISDLNSTGGTFVNEERLSAPRVLRPGDTVRFADLVVRFDAGIPPVAMPVPSSAIQVPPVPASAPGSAGPPSGNEPPGPGEPVAAGPGAVDLGATYSVAGTVLSPALPGIGGLTVQLVDKNVGGDQVLASTQTASDGGYSFEQVIGARYLADHHKTTPDLQVQVLVGDSVLAASDVSYSAPVTLSLDVVFPAGAAGLPSEYETLAANIAAVYPGSLGALQENATQQDITYLANKTGWDARAVALGALADQFSQISAPTPVPATDSQQTVVRPAPTVTVQPEFYYALFRAGVPADPASLFRTSPATARMIWEQAVANGVIPQALAKEVPAATANFQTISAAMALDLAPPAGLSTLREMLARTLPEPSQQNQFAEIYAEHQDDWPGFWTAIGQAFGATRTAQLQLTGQLYYLTVNNEPLVSALTGGDTKTRLPLASTLDLVSHGYYEPSAWAPLIGTSIPPEIPGDTADEQAANYASLLAAQVRIAYPTAVVADQVRRNILPTVGSADTADSVASFLAAHQSDFVIGVEPIDAYIARTGQGQVPADTVTAIKRIQRVYQLTPDDASMSVLLFHNLDSAFAITRYDSAGFVRAFADKLGGTDQAMRIHARARQVFATTMSLAVGYISSRVTPSYGGRVPIQLGLPPQAAPPSFPVTAYPTLEDLFGSLDYCDCTDCGSILSPAAYLVDLLNYIDQPAPAGGLANPLDILLSRRPDLQYLPLTCANTNTALPYIDVVNELLEYVVANDCQITGYQGYDTPDTITSAELIACPQNVNDDAYAVLRTAFFPPPLPFNRPLELLRYHLASLGVTLPAAMATLRRNDDLGNDATPTSFGWTDILIEQLTISRDEYRLFTDSSLQLSDLYGLPGAPPALTVLQTTSLQDFSRRLNVSYDDLVAITQTQFINPNAALIERVEQLNASFATLQQLAATVNTPASTAADFIAGLPAGLDATQYGGTDPTDYLAVVDWVTNTDNYNNIMSIIVITDPSGASDDCSGASLQFRYSNPDNSANPLSGTDFLKLIRFIRLWQKLAPLLGDPDDSVTIEQTDDILGALYPAADLPIDPGDSANDPSNRPLLDAGFTTLLPRVGFIFQLMNSLSLTGDSGLDQLLACWAPIGTAGANSLYQNMFLTSTLLQQDPGAQTATVAASVNTADVLHTLINGTQEIPPYKVQPGQAAPDVATAIAQAINTSAAPDNVDPVSGEQLSQRFLASTVAGSGTITIKAGFSLECSVTPSTATESYTAAMATPLSQSGTVGGARVTTGDTLTTAINGVPVSYQVVSGDTTETIAAGIAAAVNAATSPDPYSGLPLNSLVVAVVSGATPTEVDFIAADAGAPFTLACSLDPANAGTYSAAAPVPASCTATITGTVTPGDILVTTINSVPVSYTAVAADTDLPTLAAHIATAINVSVTVDQATSLPLSGEVQASSSGNVITITAIDPATPVSISCSAPAADGYSTAGPFPERATASVSGTMAAGTTLTTTVNTLPFFYLTKPGDTPATAAAAIAASINSATQIDPITGLPLTSVVSASANAGVITFTAGTLTTPFTLAASMSASGYTAGQATPPFADNGYGVFLHDQSQTVFGHEPTLCAAFNLTSAEFAQITQGLDVQASTPLSLPTISMIFRYGWLAQALSLSVLEFLWLRQWTGLDPFSSIDPAATPPAEPPVIRFIELLNLLQTVGLTTSQALYLMWNQDITGTSSPPLTTVTGLAFALAADFAAVDAQFTLQTDPDGTIAQNLMTLVYGAAASAFFFGLLNGTFTTSVSYSTPGGDATLPQQVIDASAGQLSYDNVAKQLTFAGVLNQATLTAINAAITASAPDVATLTAAVAGLAAANQQQLGPFFATYPELAPLYAAYTASTGSVQDKNTALLASFLPTLKNKRKQEEALAVVTSAAGVDPSFATALLGDPTILHADADVTLAAITDLMALENQGLSAQFFLGNNLASPPDQVIDSVAVLSYAQTVTIGGAPTTGDMLETTINGAVIGYTVLDTDTTVVTLANGLVSAINTTAVTDPVSGLPLSQVVTATALPPGQGASIVITIAGLDPSGANGSFTLTTAVTGSGSEHYTCASQLPAGTGGGDIAAIWSGYLTAAQDGFYDINVIADPGAQVTLAAGGLPVPMAQASPAAPWSNQSTISLTAGALMPIVLTATSVKKTFSVSWLSDGTGWQPIGTKYLFPFNPVSRLGNTYVRFLKASSLASALSLTAAEIAYLGTSTSYPVNTTDATLITPGSAIFTPASMTNIAIGSVLVIDDGAAQETVTVTATAPTTFSAVAVNGHDGTTTPFAIVSSSNPVIGEGWLNFLIGSGWLTGLPTRPGPDPATAASLTGVLQAVSDFARMKQALSPADSRLLAVLQDPGATLPTSPAVAQTQPSMLPVTNSALLSLTGWNLANVNALLTQFFGRLSPASLSSVENLSRVYDAYSLVTTCGLSAAALISAITNAPTPGTVSALESALRAQYGVADWLTVVGPINDQARTSQRDALVAYILQRLGDSYAASLVSLTTTAAAATGATQLTFAVTSQISQAMAVQGLAIAPGTTVATVTSSAAATTVTLSNAIVTAMPAGGLVTFEPLDSTVITDPDSLYEYFLIDTQNEPAVLTSRILLALSTVQLFIERIVRNLEVAVSPGDIDQTQWTPMKRYRVWQANREVFLWPENWLYPELRDDQSPFFTQMMSSLLQGDVTDDAAASAYLTYLTSLEEVAKLEPCGMYYVPASADADERCCVIARTAGARRKYYYRELTSGSWTPWAEVQIDCEDMPLTPIIWNGRLFLFWLKVTKQPQPAANTFSSNSEDIASMPPGDIGNFQQGGLNAGSSKSVAASAVLYWTEFYNGTWQPTKTSDPNLPTSLGMNFDPTGANSLESCRNLIGIVPAQCTGTNPAADGLSFPLPSDALMLAITMNGASNYVGGFILHNTHSLPIRLDDIYLRAKLKQLHGLGHPNLPKSLLSILDQPGMSRSLAPQITPPYTGGYSVGDFSINYIGPAVSAPVSPGNLLQFSWAPRCLQPQPWLPDPWGAPFIYEDRRHMFYVVTTENWVSIEHIISFGMLSTSLGLPKASTIQPLILRQSVITPTPSEILAVNASAAGPAAVQRYIAGQTDLTAALPTQLAISYQGQVITPIGSLATVSASPLNPTQMNPSTDREDA